MKWQERQMLYPTLYVKAFCASDDPPPPTTTAISKNNNPMRFFPRIDFL